MDWLKPAIAFTTLSSAVVAASFLYVGLTLVRKRYVLMWAFAWLVSIPQLAFAWRLLDHPGSRIDWTLQFLFLTLNTQLVLAGCYSFAQQRMPVRSMVGIWAATFTWVLTAPLAIGDFHKLTLPGSLLLGVSYLWTASRFLQLHRERQRRGSRVLAILFLLAGLHEFDYPLFGNSPWAAPIGYTIAAAFGLAIGLSLLVLVLEESRADAESQRTRVGAILENLPIGVVVTAPDGHVQILNALAREVAGRVPDEARADVAALEPAMFRETSGSVAEAEGLPINMALRTGAASSARELLLVEADGATRQVLVNAGPVLDEHGSMIGAIGVFQDMQELKRMQVEIARAQKLQSIGTLAAGVAHDFNNALTMILGHAELAQSVTTDPRVRERLDIVARVASDSAASVRRLQDMARTRVARDNMPLDLTKVVREIIDIASPRWRNEAQSRGVNYAVQFDSTEPVWLAGQAEELREALLNLTFNALDAMPEGGTLSFAVTCPDGAAVLTITDSGVGMNAEVRERIFDPFFSTKGQRGTGLGLSVVFSIVERHRGKISVQSQPGRGTPFEMRFPLTTPPPSAQISATSANTVAGPAVAPAQAVRILMVDDEPLVRTLTATMLKGAGYLVEAAESGEQALRWVREQHFDIVLTDLGMPGMNGWEVATAVQAVRPEARVVLVTGWGETISSSEAQSGGVARILSKPFTRAQLLQCISELACQPQAAAVR